MTVATLIDGKALVDVVVVSFALTVAAVTAFGTAVLAADRASDARDSHRRPVAPWIATLAVAAIGCTAILVLGIWAMTQK